MATIAQAPQPEVELVPTRKSLLERLRDLGNQAAWQQFFDTYWRLIYRAAIRGGLSNEEAEEVVQETVIGVSRQMENFQYQPERCSFKGWLMHITRRRVIDHRRKRMTRPKCFVPLPADTHTSEDEPQIADAAAQRQFESLWDEEWQKNLVDVAMERVKGKISNEHYQIFYMHNVKRMSGRDIGELLGVSRTKVYVVRHRVERLVRREVRLLAEKSL